MSSYFGILQVAGVEMKFFMINSRLDVKYLKKTNSTDAMYGIFEEKKQPLLSFKRSWG